MSLQQRAVLTRELTELHENNTALYNSVGFKYD